MNIVIWNSQGYCLDDEKKQELIDVVNRFPDDPPVIVIQEAGYREDFDTKSFGYDIGSTYLGQEYVIYQMKPYELNDYEKTHSKVNYRCSLMTMIPKIYNNGISVYPLLVNNFSNRPHLVVSDGNLRICNIHAPAGKPEFAAECIKESVSHLNLYNMPWILCGDMNVEPDILDDISGITSRKARIYTSGYKTHKKTSGIATSEFDYFICDTSITLQNIFVVQQSYSDHDIVIASL
ncbi:MAG: hypothetical protein ACI4E1_12170 [Lachnospira sp.]